MGRLNAEPVVVAGVDFSRAARLTGYWRVQGARQAGAAECLAGTAAAAHFRLSLGSRAALEGAPCVVRGIVETGGAEDAQLLLPFAAAASLGGFQERASLIQVRADGRRLDQVREALARALPGADVRELHAVAETEASVVLQVRGVLFWLTALVLAVTTLCVTSNFGALVLERSREIGILKAIGAGERQIGALFLCESLLLACGSAIAGYAAGLLVAWWIGREIFSGAAVGVNFAVFLPVLAVTLAVAAAATLLAASRIWRIRPAIILRGE